MESADVAALVARCAPTVAPSTMQAILRVESGFKPHVIGYLVRSPQGKFNLSRQPRSKEEAIAWATWMHANGYRFDAGPAQVNSSNFERYGLTPASAFEPCQNIGAGGAILTSEYLRAVRKFGPGQYALRAAISSYNSGNYVTGFSNGYVRHVSNAAAQSTRPPLQPQRSASR
ncbi:Type IV secretion system protein virB1 (plasmid) [Variovorax sp. SRS16]|uniref:lytic transglycosylase domain-containing protein n=1 Tax=Variovorax sp. SRS16 TaxID=282217 RepID=UPI001315BA32|nr:lytic transglycosylase domain-containing protein [Variovorax sp. SRS16]VTU46191.1 Type IV secretion system protein virB1 [Variovorax sp. SRS16]